MRWLQTKLEALKLRVLADRFEIWPYLLGLFLLGSGLAYLIACLGG